MRALLIVARNLGDAAITVDFLRNSAVENPKIKWHIWCRPSVEFLFSGLPNVSGVSCSNFPVGTTKNFGINALKQLIGKLRRLRREKFDFSMDLVGDFREVLIGRLCGSSEHISPRWGIRHSFYKIIRPSPNWLVDEVIMVPDSIRGVYDVYAELSRSLSTRYGQTRLQSADRSSGRKDANLPNRGAPPSKRLVGVHPFASMDCKRWSDEKWRELIVKLLSNGNRVVAFGAPSERAALLQLTQGILAEDKVFTLPIVDFFEKVKELDLLVGLDSFSIHAAHLNGTRSIMINGSNDPFLFVPDTSIRLANVSNCGYQPCMNVPKCLAMKQRYNCNLGVPVASVLAAVVEPHTQSFYGARRSA